MNTQKFIELLKELKENNQELYENIIKRFRTLEDISDYFNYTFGEYKRDISKKNESRICTLTVFAPENDKIFSQGQCDYSELFNLINRDYKSKINIKEFCEMYYFMILFIQKFTNKKIHLDGKLVANYNSYDDLTILPLIYYYLFGPAVVNNLVDFYHRGEIVPGAFIEFNEQCDCLFCIDCVNCTNSRACYNCDSCTDCLALQNSYKCNNCSYSTHLMNCNLCTEANILFNAERLTGYQVNKDINRDIHKITESFSASFDKVIEFDEYKVFYKSKDTLSSVIVLANNKEIKIIDNLNENVIRLHNCGAINTPERLNKTLISLK